jgi:hypothetical protein
MRILVTFWLAGIVTFCLTLVSTAQVKPATPIVITHATVINPGTSSVQANRTVVISGDHITSVSDAAQFQPPKNARVINATGQYLIPGLWDMHVHSAFGDWFPGGRDIILPLFVANGVTGVRDMGGDVPVLLEWRKEIKDGAIIGPRMVISGPMLDGYLPNGKLRSPVPLPSPLQPAQWLPLTCSKRRVWTSLKFNLSFRTMRIWPLLRRPTSKGCQLSVMCPTRCGFEKLSKRDKRVSSI